MDVSWLIPLTLHISSFITSQNLTSWLIQRGLPEVMPHVMIWCMNGRQGWALSTKHEQNLEFGDFIPGELLLLEGNLCNFEGGNYHLDGYFNPFHTKISENLYNFWPHSWDVLHFFQHCFPPYWIFLKPGVLNYYCSWATYIYSEKSKSMKIFPGPGPCGQYVNSIGVNLWCKIFTTSDFQSTEDENKTIWLNLNGCSNSHRCTVQPQIKLFLCSLIILKWQ